MIDYERQRLTMVESQLRPNQVTDRALLAAMSALPRERFVPVPARPLAYMDDGVEIFPAIDGAPARYLLAPVLLARLIQLAGVGPDDRMLDIGCATGYSTAVLALLARHVIGIEAEPELAEAARQTLHELARTHRLDRAEIVTGPLNEGYPAGAPYDVILLNGSVQHLPDSVADQLKEGGRCVGVVASNVAGKAYLFVKADGTVSGVPHFDAGAKPLPGLTPMPSFTF
jgi:protein-L-isoaspartate(D-aspartate) O-methyltransferase